MPIPKLVRIVGAPAMVLPPGIHRCSLDEARVRFAFNPHRQRIFDGFEQVHANLQSAGCTAVYLNGGFASDSPAPKDFDGCWDPTGVNPRLVDPVLFDYANDRAAQKQKYYGEMFLSMIPEAASGKIFLDFFQTERNTGKTKGILVISSGAKVTP